MLEDETRTFVMVPVSVHDAFQQFVERFSEWWPVEYTWSGRVLEFIGIDPHEGGKCYELGPDGFRLDWGRVVAWHAPLHLGFTWQISPTRVPEPDPARASRVDVRFYPEEDGARIELLHSRFAQHGEGWQQYRDAMGSEHGWPYILERFALSLQPRVDQSADR